MAAKDSPTKDLGRRVAAARAYRDLDQVTAAKRLKLKTPATLGRYERGDIPDRTPDWLIKQSAKAFDLPEAFFRIDFKNLGLVETWEQAEDGTEPPPLPPSSTIPPGDR